MRKNRNGRGRPALPDHQRKQGLSVHMPVEIIDRLGEIADGRNISRNKLAAAVLTDFVLHGGAGQLAHRGGANTATVGTNGVR